MAVLFEMTSGSSRLVALLASTDKGIVGENIGLHALILHLNKWLHGILELVAFLSSTDKGGVCDHMPFCGMSTNSSMGFSALWPFTRALRRALQEKTKQDLQKTQVLLPSLAYHKHRWRYCRN